MRMASSRCGSASLGLAARDQRLAEVVLSTGKRRAHPDRLAEVRDCLVQAPLEPQLEADAVEGDEVVVRHRQRVFEERRRGAPDLYLAPREHRARDGERGREADERNPRPRASRGDLGCAPCDHDGEADRRNVRVAIRARLAADLHEPEHGHERPEVPAPADGEIRARRQPAQRERRDGNEHGHRQARFPPGHHRRVGVEDRQVSRPAERRGVGHVGPEGVGQPQAGGHPIERGDGTRGVLRDVRDDGAGRRQGQQRHLLQHQVAGGRRIERGQPQAAERPHVEQQQHERQRDDHRLREQAERERHGDEKVAPPAGPPDVVRVADEGQHPEEAAQHVLPLRHPGDRLDVQRVDPEQERDQGARPACAGHPPHGDEQQERAQRVQREIGQVVGAARRGRTPKPRPCARARSAETSCRRCRVVNAHCTPAQVRPALTCALAVTYWGSSMERNWHRPTWLYDDDGGGDDERGEADVDRSPGARRVHDRFGRPGVRASPELLIPPWFLRAAPPRRCRTHGLSIAVFCYRIVWFSAFGTVARACRDSTRIRCLPAGGARVRRVARNQRGIGTAPRADREGRLHRRAPGGQRPQARRGRHLPRARRDRRATATTSSSATGSRRFGTFVNARAGHRAGR